MPISVIIPSYNRAWCLEDTLQSVTYAHSYVVEEIIVVDNGSDDHSCELVAKMSEEDQRIRWVDGSHLPKNGNAARNLGFRVSQGEYIQFLDSDDKIVAGKMESQLDWLRNQGSACLATSQWVNFTKHGDRPAMPQRVTWNDYASGISLLQDLLLNNQWFCPGTWLLPRALCEAVGPWDETCSADQDRDYLTRLLIKADAVYCYPDTGLRYRVGSEDHVSTQTNPRHQASRWAVWQKSRDMLLEKADTQRSRAALAQALMHVSYAKLWQDEAMLDKASQSFKTIRKEAPLTSRPYLLGFLARMLGLKQAVKIRRKF